MYLGQIIFSAIAIRVRKTCLIERRLPKKRALIDASRAISWVPSTARHLLGSSISRDMEVQFLCMLAGEHHGKMKTG